VDAAVHLEAATLAAFVKDVNHVRYFGVLASAAANRDAVVPFSEPPEGAFKPPPAAGDQPLSNPQAHGPDCRARACPTFQKFEIRGLRILSALTAR
jgi:hypothetical protein